MCKFETVQSVFLVRQEKGAPLQQLEQACQGWAPEDRGASKELNDWQHQLRSLVQAGIPMVTGTKQHTRTSMCISQTALPEPMIYVQTLRGKMWRTFLGLEAVKQEGYYEQLVHQALGDKYSKRKVRVLHNCHMLAGMQ